MTQDGEAPSFFPTFRYRDAAAMIAWLGEAFGFRVTAKHMDGDAIAHAELALGGSLIMLGQVRDDAYGARVGAPGQGPESQGGKSLYIAVDDADSIFASAKAAGARILEEPVDRDYGSREFTCADPEGNIWVFGTYRPEVGGSTS